MTGLLTNLTTAVLMVSLLTSAMALVDPEKIAGRPFPWAAAGLTVTALAGVALQLAWPGAMAALDHDPRKPGWWRVLTSVFLQNGGVLGTVFNLVTLAVIAALAEWYWGHTLMPPLFLAGAILPEHLDALLGTAGHGTDPRDFAGSSGATYFLAATLAAALLPDGDDRWRWPLALGVPVFGLALWFAQANAHGLVTAEGFVLGGLVWTLRRRTRRPDREPPPRETVRPAG